MRQIAGHPESYTTEKELLGMLDAGGQCFGLKHNNKIVSYMWINFKKINHWLHIPLEPDEAYLYNAVTYKTYRGKSIAPYLRSQIYRYLMEMGRNNVYSITEAFNTPAKKAKAETAFKASKTVSLYQHSEHI